MSRWVPLTAAVLGLTVALIPVRGQQPGTDPASAAVAGPGAVALPVPSTLPPAPDVPDPFPIRRVFVPPERLDGAIAQAGPGGLLRLPRTAFEDKVRAASAAQAAATDPPRLAEGHYRAVWGPNGLTGTADWTVTYPTGRGGPVGLDGLRVATWEPRWAGGRTALVFRAGGDKSGPVLLADAPGDTAVSLQWSCRGTEEPTAERFDLGFPAAPVALLTLDLPADREPSVPAAGPLLTGPFPAAAGRKLWRLSFGGQSRVELTVRRPGREAEPPALARSGRSARHELSPGEAVSTFEFDAEAVRGAIAELLLETSPGLRVTGVTGTAPLTWRAESRGSGVVRVRVGFRDPVPACKLTVTATSVLPTPPPSAWTCPRIRVVGGLPGGDAVEVRADAEVRYLGCDPGDFRVADAGDDGTGYRVGFVGSLLADPLADRRPPTVRLTGAAPEFTTSEQLVWTVGRGANSLTARLKVAVLRGPLATFSFAAPADFNPESATLTPDDTGSALTPGPNGTWTVEPSRPIPTGSSLDVRIEFRGPSVLGSGDPASGPRPPQVVPFPRFAPVGAAERDGTFQVVVDPTLTAQVSPFGPKPGAIPFRGREPEGVVSLGTRPVAVSATSDTVVTLDGNALGAKTTLRVRPESGVLGAATVWAARVADSTWDLTGPPGVAIEPVPATAVVPWSGLLGAASGWQAVAATPVGATTPVTGWRVTLARPPQGEVAISAAWKGPPGPPDGAVVPLPTVLGAKTTRVGVSLSPTAASKFDTPLPPADPSAVAPAVRLAPVGSTPPPVPGRAKGWAFEAVSLQCRIEETGSLACRFSGRVLDAKDPALRVALPPGAEWIEARIGGKLAAAAAEGHDPDRTVYALPLPPVQPDGVAFDIAYQLPRPAGWGVLTYLSPPPTLPAGPSVAAVQWSAASQVALVQVGRSPGEDTPFATVIPVDVTAGLGALLAALVAAVGFRAGFRAGRFWTVALVASVGAFGVAAWLLPAALQAVAVLPLVVGLVVLGVHVSFRPPPVGKRSPRASAAGLATGLALLGGAAAQAPDPWVAVVTPAPARPNQYDVLVSPNLIRALEALTRPAVPGPIITAAEYDGAVDGSAVFRAKLTVWSPAAGEGKLALPLSGVKLRSVAVDGKPAFPEAEAQRYAVAVAGAGPHEVRVQFDVPIATSGADREVQFGVPDVPGTRVGFRATPGSAFLDVSSRRGEQRPTDDGGTPRVEAHHGGGREVAIRWRAANAGGTNPVVSVREAAVWDLREAGTTVSAVFQFKIDGGSVTRLELDVPDDLEPAKLVVRGADGRSVGVGLKEWQLGPPNGGWQSLELGLQGPVDGSVVVAVRLYPKRPLSGRPVLRLPRAKGVAGTNSYCALRPTGVSADEVARVGVDDYPVDGLTKEFAFAPELALDRYPPNRAFRRKSDAPVELRPELRPAGPGATGTARSTWVVGARADVDGELTVTGRDTPVSAVEWELHGPVRVTEVRSPGLAAWSQVGSRVQAWLRKPSNRAVDVRWSGTLTGYQRSGRAGSEPGPVDLPVAKLVGVEPTPTDFWVRPADGWGVALQPAAGVRGAGDKYTLDPSAAPVVKFTGTPPNPPPAVEAAVDL